MRFMMASTLALVVGLMAWAMPQTAETPRTMVPRVSGVVVDSSGATLAGATVELLSGTRVVPTATADCLRRVRLRQPSLRGIPGAGTSGGLQRGHSGRFGRIRPTAPAALDACRCGHDRDRDSHARLESERQRHGQCATAADGDAGGWCGRRHRGRDAGPAPSGFQHRGCTVGSTRTAIAASPSIRSRRSRSTWTPRPTPTSAAFSTTARCLRLTPCASKS